MSNLSLNFVPWLHSQAIADRSRSMVYAPIYKLGPEIEHALGEDGRYNLDLILANVSDADQYADLFVHAEAAWRIDVMCQEHPEEMAAPVEYVEAQVLVNTNPIPCGYRGIDGKGCAKDSVPGAARCDVHGGAILDPEVRKSILLVTYAKMIQGSRTAVDTLVDVLETSQNDMARVKAAETILDRVGLSPDQRIQIETKKDDSEGALERLLSSVHDRLGTAKDRLQMQLVPVNTLPTVTFENTQVNPAPVSVPVYTKADEDVIDAEIIE